MWLRFSFALRSNHYWPLLACYYWYIVALYCGGRRSENCQGAREQIDHQSLRPAPEQLQHMKFFLSQNQSQHLVYLYLSGNGWWIQKLKMMETYFFAWWTMKKEDRRDETFVNNAKIFFIKLNDTICAIKNVDERNFVCFFFNRFDGAYASLSSMLEAS